MSGVLSDRQAQQTIGVLTSRLKTQMKALDKVLEGEMGAMISRDVIQAAKTEASGVDRIADELGEREEIRIDVLREFDETHDALTEKIEVAEEFIAEEYED